jgi:hypothetical protein
MPTLLFAWACTPEIGEHAQAKAAAAASFSRGRHGRVCLSSP